MTLSDMANHICTQTGMTDTDDLSAAQMFLQRRLEMIWNSQLWRDSLVEALLTVNPDGSTTLEDTVWLPSIGVLLLPSAIEKVIAARTDVLKLEVASLESYFRSDYDWLNYQGTPTDFQVLSPCVWQFSEPATLALGIANAADANVTATVRTVDASGVSCSQSTVTLASPQSATFQAERVDTIAKAATQGNVTLIEFSPVDVTGINYTAGNNGTATVAVTQGQEYQILPGTNENAGFVVNGTQQVAMISGTMFTLTAQGTSIQFFRSLGGVSLTATINAITVLETIQAACNTAPLHQRIRLTQIPNVSTNLRVLGKKKCPILGVYDVAPITNVEPSLMAFARGDLLLRQRQFGKAALAQQEGATLLKELANDEAIQQAANFRIDPDNGFGSDSITWTQPNSLHPL